MSRTRTEGAAGLLGDDERLAALADEGVLFAVTARSRDLAAPIPSCPGWTLGDLVAHLGLVYRWVTRVGTVRVCDGTDLVPRVAADGVDEMVCGFITRYAEHLRADVASTIALHATDTGGRWWIRLSADAPTSGRGATSTGPRDAEIQATAGELFLLLWNRRSADDLHVRGDRAALENWRRGAHR